MPVSCGPLTVQSLPIRVVLVVIQDGLGEPLKVVVGVRHVFASSQVDAAANHSLRRQSLNTNSGVLTSARRCMVFTPKGWDSIAQGIALGSRSHQLPPSLKGW